MELNPGQQSIVDNFYSQFLPTQKLGHLREYTDRNSVSMVYPGIFTERPNIEQKQFNAEIINRIFFIHQLSLGLRTKLLRLGQVDARVKRIIPFNFILLFFHEFGKHGVAFKEQFKWYKLNSRIISAWVRQKPQKMGEFEVYNTLALHPEAPLCIGIRNLKGSKIGALGGYLYKEGGKTALQITNIQGVNTHGVEEHARQYAELSRTVMENWRIFFLKRIAEIASKRGIKVVGKLPEFYYFFQTESGHKRVVRQYKQTYMKAGFKPRANKTWVVHARKRKRKK